MLDPNSVNSFYPVMAITYNPLTGTAKVMRGNPTERKMPPGKPGNKKHITYLSQSSLQRLAFLAMNTSTQFRSMMTLTYLSPPTVQEAKRQLALLLQFLRRKAGLKNWLWFIEFTKAGIPHYHILMDIEHCSMHQKSTALFWARLTMPYNTAYSNRKTRKTGMTQENVLKVHSHKRMWENIRKPDGAKRYCLKYCLKPYQKTPPVWWKMTGRFWGMDKTTSQINYDNWVTLPIKENDLRTYLHAFDHKVKKWDVIPKIIFNFPIPPEETKE